MIHYPDTSFLCAIYRVQVHSTTAWDLKKNLAEPLHYTALLEFEFLQAIELQVFLHSNDRTRGYGRREAKKMVADWKEDIESGVNKIVPCDMDTVLRLSRAYSLQVTATGGHRTLDVLHVATAVHLGAKKFLTFDTRQKALAEHAGLEVPT